MSNSAGNPQTTFAEAYQALNKNQKLAVDTIEGPVLVSAGPGTGKTQMLALRIVNILKETDTAPENILALTFTDSGAHAMRSRLRIYLGNTAFRIPVHTFHSFAGLCIGSYPEAYEKVAGNRVADEVDRFSIVTRLLAEGKTPNLRPLSNPELHIKKIIGAIDTLKQEYITPDKFLGLLEQERTALDQMEKYHTKGAHKGKIKSTYSKAEKQLKKNEQLAYLYQRYELLLKEERLYDFADMLLETVRAMENNQDLLLDLQETYQYVLADEHQDVNGTQNKLLELLVSYHDSPNIFAVGDEKQAIYRFQGASLENFLYFTDHFQDTKIITLTDNYRSGPAVLQVAHTLIKTDDPELQSFRLPLDSALVKEAQVTYRNFSHEGIEEDWLATQVSSSIEAGTPPEEIAVVVRTNREVEKVADLLRKKGCQVNASADSDILEHPITQSIQELILACCNLKQEERLVGLLHAPYFKVPPDDVVAVLAARSRKEPLVRLMQDKERLQECGVQDPEAILQIVKVLEAIRAYTKTHGALRGFEYLLESSGFLAHLYEQNATAGIRIVRRLYDEIELLMVRTKQSGLADIASLLSMRQEHGLGLSAPFIADTGSAVQVLTAHKAKGLEFEQVFIPFLKDGNWGGRRRPELFSLPIETKATRSDLEDDERRLLYVAMTRAKKSLFLSTSKKDVGGAEKEPSRFVLECCQENVCAEVSTESSEEQFDIGANLKTAPVSYPFAFEKIANLFQEKGFSATAINNYLKSPWSYIYRNLLHVPEVKTFSLMYGTAVHEVLRRVVEIKSKKQTPVTDSQLNNFIHEALANLPVTETEYTQMHEKAYQSLLVYLETLYGYDLSNSKTEYTLSAVLQTDNAQIPEIPLTGNIDRIDFNKDGSVARVVDYKTGTPKTRNQIEGKTKQADAGYKRQLIFYALLLELQDNELLKSRTTTLSFVEPTGSGVIKEETFTILDEDIAEMKTIIKTAVEELATGKFLSEKPEEGTVYEKWLDSLLQSKNS